MNASEVISVEGQKKFEPLSVNKPSGAIILDGQHVADTLQCKHCGKHWIPIKGSGIVRGWCTHCNGVTCGAPDCMKCVPFEQRLDEVEKGIRKTLK